MAYTANNALSEFVCKHAVCLRKMTQCLPIAVNPYCGDLFCMCAICL